MIFSLIYICVTFVALVFLNIYCSKACQNKFCMNKQTVMLGKARLTADKLGRLDSMTHSAVSTTVEDLGLNVTQTIVTTPSGQLLYCSDERMNSGQVVTYPQIKQALEGNDVFTWSYDDGVMRSASAMPITANGVTVGCVYLTETDTEQGRLIMNLQRTILTITVLLELVVIAFALYFYRHVSRRMRKIMNSMKILQQGDYSHKLIMGGNDEFTVLAEEFNNLTERLETSEKKRTQFVFNASHELKTPLASIKLLSDSILQNDMDSETVREFVGDIGNEAERLNRMSEKLLSLTKGESNEQPQMEIIYMAPTVNRVVNMLTLVAQASGITIETYLEDDVPILIVEDDFYEIIFNLAENGIKYNQPGGKLIISLQRGEDCGILTIADTGTGIPEDCVSHIFERFYRVDKARSRATGGSGLGLSIVRNIVDRNQCSIHVESQLGIGTTFTVEFPAFDIEEGEPEQ